MLPTAEFFPDHFDRSAKSVERLLHRIQGQCGLSDVPLQLEVAGAEGGAGGSCSTGGCCGPAAGAAGRFRRVRLAADGDGYVVAVAATEVASAPVLTTGLVRAVSHVFLTEADLYPEFERAEYEPAVDLAGIMLGFGVLLGNGAYLYSKGCGGVKIGSATLLPVEEIGVGLALYGYLHDVPPRVCRGHLEPTPRAAFDEAHLWVRSNAGVARLVRSDRAALEADSYQLSEARSWLSRLFGLGRSKGPTVPTDDELEQVAKSIESSRSKSEVDPDKQRRLQEIRELVDEALDN